MIRMLALTSIFFNTFFGINAMAQTIKKNSEEKIILQDNKPSNQVEVEIKDGNVFIDGKKVAPYALNRNLKIIKKLNRAFSNGETPDVELNFPKSTSPQDAPLENKAMLGVSTEATTNNNGAVVKSVNANTPAAKADLHEGDIITKVDKVAITSPQDLVTAISNYKPGAKTNITINRDGKEINKEITLAAKEDNGFGNIFGGPDGDGEDMMGSIQKMLKKFGDFSGGTIEENDGNDNIKIFGNGVPSNNNPKLGAQVEERADGQGLRVASVKDASAAAKAGIKTDDIINSFNGKAVNNIDELSKAITSVKDNKNIPIEIQRNGKLQTIYMQIEKPLRKKEF